LKLFNRIAAATNRKTSNAISRPLEVSIIILPLFLLGFLLARFAAPIFNLLPACTFRTLSGIPCPGCGVTRAGLALANGELFSAFALNPLFVIGVGALSLSSAIEWLERLSGKTVVTNYFQKMLSKTLPRQWLRGLIIAALVLNWLYLIK